jgi:hypothetical protein
MMDGKDRICKTCQWSRYNWCQPGKMISNQGNCQDYKMRKLSRAEKRKTKRQQGTRGGA